MAVTIYDIATDAGVSIATVSRVVNGNRRVAEATRTLVLDSAKRLGYQPHASARSLARRRSSIVSAVIPDLTNYFFIDVLGGLQDRMAESEFDLLVFSARTLEEVDQQVERALARGRSAGLLLFSTPMADDRVERLERSGQSVVLVDSACHRFDSVWTDNREGGLLAVRHLVERGARRIALVMANPASVPAAERHDGYAAGLSEAGLQYDPDLVVTSTDPAHHGYSEAAGYAETKRLLSSGVMPDALFATSDVQAIGAMQALRESGREIPVDVQVVGFDDIMVSRHVGLTTVQQPMYEMGRLGADLLLSRIEAPDRDPTQTTLSPRLVARSSTANPVREAVQQASGS